MAYMELIRVGQVLPLLDALDNFGIDTDHALRQCSLPSGLSDLLRDGYLPKPAFIAFLNATTPFARVPELISIALAPPDTSRLNDHLVARVRSRTCLRSRLEELAEASLVEHTDFRFSLTLEGSHTRLVVARDTSADARDWNEWLQLGSILAVVRDALGLRAQGCELALRAPARSLSPLSEALGPIRVRGGALRSSLLIPNSLLDDPIDCETAVPSPSDETAIKNTLARLSDLPSRLKLVLSCYLGEAQPPIGSAASFAGMSVRSLQRQLERAGMSYSDIVQHVRFEQAVKMLVGGRSKVIDIALSLGYEDASHFSRAFRRMAGLSPRQYRSEHVFH